MDTGYISKENPHGYHHGTTNTLTIPQVATQLPTGRQARKFKACLGNTGIKTGARILRTPIYTPPQKHSPT